MRIRILDFMYILIRRMNIRFPLKEYLRYNQAKNFTACEVGVARGDNARQMLKIPYLKKLYLVDIWNNKKHYEIAKKKLSKYNVEFIKEKSDDAIIPKCEFIYIDGDHSKEQVKKDLDKYWKMVKDGGMLAGDDWEMEGVWRSVIDKFGIENINTGEGNQWWVWKNNKEAYNG